MKRKNGSAITIGLACFGLGMRFGILYFQEPDVTTAICRPKGLRKP